MTQLRRFGADLDTAEVNARDAVLLAEKAHKAGDFDLAADWIALAYAKFDRQFALEPGRRVRATASNGS